MEFTSKKIELIEYTADSGKCFKKADKDGDVLYTVRLIGAGINIEDYEIVSIDEKLAYEAANSSEDE